RLSARGLEAHVVGHGIPPLCRHGARLPVPRGAARRPADRARARGSAPRGEAARAVSTRDELLRILVRRSYLREPGKQFRLASGRLSDYYIEGSLTTTYHGALPLIGQLVHAYYSAGTTRPLSWFSVRKAAKEHGARRWLEGSAARGDGVVVVEDVITSGGSLIDAVRKCGDEGLRVLASVVLVDREEDGGRARVEEALATIGARLYALFTRSDLERAWQAARGG
ncbi:MAG: hypothetical protein E6J70_16770, partial [Deltaproteobacteria bacterium]